MSIMDIFKPAKPESQAATTNSNPTGKENLSENPPTKDAQGKMPGTEPQGENPLDAYRKMYENANTNNELTEPVFSIDPKVLGDVSKKMDFTRGINPETLQKATSGDVTALMDIIKSVGQNAYRASLEHSTALTDSHLKTRGDFESKKLERGVNKKLTESALSTAPNYSHPVVKAELNRIASQIAASNPDASPKQVAESAQQYLTDLYGALNPNAGKTAKEIAGNDEMDWSKYLGS